MKPVRCYNCDLYVMSPEHWILNETVTMRQLETVCCRMEPKQNRVTALCAHCLIVSFNTIIHFTSICSCLSFDS